jgi:hypothetical protein
MPETSPCMHLCSCPRCGFDTRIEVCQVVMG